VQWLEYHIANLQVVSLIPAHVCFSVICFRLDLEALPRSYVLGRTSIKVKELNSVVTMFNAISVYGSVITRCFIYFANSVAVTVSVTGQRPLEHEFKPHLGVMSKRCFRHLSYSRII